jgi:DNA-binding response OmpR family regulator
LDRIVFAFESLLARKKITLDCDTSGIAGLTLDVDQDKFEIVINNLMHNAAKFNREGGWIKVFAQRNNETVIIRVSDSGVGIPERDLPFVFDRFYQSNATEKLSAQGIGIGLSLVRDFTELHGGEVAVSSRVNEGSSFTVQLPIISVADADIGESVESSELPAVNFKSFSRRPHILIVEDNDEMRFYLKEILGNDLDITEAQHGGEALQWLESRIPDLIISDVMMPEMDGPEFLRQLKRSRKYRGIPVVMLTARAAEEDVLHGLSLGVDDYIIKPFHASELKIRIHNLITNQQIRREWAQRPAEADEVTKQITVEEDERFKDKIRLFVEAHAANGALAIGDLCEHMVMSERQFYRKAATLTGMTPAQLIKEVRLKIAYRLLLEGKVTKVSDVVKRVGFDNISYFSRQFEARFGKRPTDML